MHILYRWDDDKYHATLKVTGSLTPDKKITVDSVVLVEIIAAYNENRYPTKIPEINSVLRKTIEDSFMNEIRKYEGVWRIIDEKLYKCWLRELLTPSAYYPIIGKPR